MVRALTCLNQGPHRRTEVRCMPAKSKPAPKSRRADGTEKKRWSAAERKERGHGPRRRGGQSNLTPRRDPRHVEESPRDTVPTRPTAGLDERPARPARHPSFENRRAAGARTDRRPATRWEDRRPAFDREDRRPSLDRDARRPSVSREDRRPSVGREDRRPSTSRDERRRAPKVRDARPGYFREDRRHDRSGAPIEHVE